MYIIWPQTCGDLIFEKGSDSEEVQKVFGTYTSTSLKVFASSLPLFGIPDEEHYILLRKGFCYLNLWIIVVLPSILSMRQRLAE